MADPKLSPPWSTVDHYGKVMWYGLSRQAIDTFKTQVAASRAAEDAALKERCLTWRTLLATTIKQLIDAGFKARVVKQRGTMRRAPSYASLSDALLPYMPEYPQYTQPYSELERTIQRAEAQLLVQQKETEEKQKEKALASKTARAILFCQSKGKILGQDFEIADAIRTATDIVFSEYTKAAEDAGEYMEFSGDDNCENCKGWLPGERRCDCGNRRVSWSSDGAWEDLRVYPEAY